jgi:hypothetical protein
MDALEALRSQLDATLNRALHSWESLGKSLAMSRTLEEVRRHHASPAERINERTVAMAVAAFIKTGQLSGFRDLKYVCLGAGSIGTNGQCVLAQKHLRVNLLTLAESDEPRRQLKCFQSLLRSYWSFPLNGVDIPETAREGWTVLRSWLANRQKALDKIVTHKPEWFVTLSRHSNLLTDKPCDRYGPALLCGDGTELDQAIKELAIPTESWVMEEAVFAQMESAYALRDEDFKNALPQLLSIAQGRAGVNVSKPLATRCVALLVIRYSLCASKPEHMELRDSAISVIGNPWLRRASWDAYVCDDSGKPNDASREMVNGWLKRRLICDFFELLSEDGSADTRRLDYWLRFEPLIEDMWFALGVNARDKRSESFGEFRHRAKGRLLYLDQTTADNNAFVMRIGEYLAVEFGAKGNAFYLFRWDTLPRVLTQMLMSGKERAFVSIHSLKSSEKQDRLIHRDRPNAGLSWEQKFDDFICPLIGSRPQEKPRCFGKVMSVRPAQPMKAKAAQVSRFNWLDFEKLVAKHSLRVIDHRDRSGSLWVKTNDLNAAIADSLKAWGFRYKTGKGWWKE